MNLRKSKIKSKIELKEEKLYTISFTKNELLTLYHRLNLSRKAFDEAYNKVCQADTRECYNHYKKYVEPIEENYTAWHKVAQLTGVLESKELS